MTYLFVSHDLNVVRLLWRPCHRHAGRRDRRTGARRTCDGRAKPSLYPDPAGRRADAADPDRSPDDIRCRIRDDPLTRPLRDLPFTLTALRDAYTAGVTPAEVMVEVHARLADAQDPAIFIHLASPEELAAEAAALGSFDQPDRFGGYPSPSRTTSTWQGMPTTAACPDYAYDAEIDAFVVARLRAAGAIPVGKTNLDQFATGLVGVRSPYGVPRKTRAGCGGSVPGGVVVGLRRRGGPMASCPSRSAPTPQAPAACPPR